MDSENEIHQRCASVRMDVSNEKRIAVLRIGAKETVVALGNRTEPQTVLGLAVGRGVRVGLGISLAAADEIARRFRKARDEPERLFEQDRATINQEGTV